MTITRRRSLAAGFGALSHTKLILLLALTSAVLGLLGALPMTAVFHSVLGKTLAGDHFIRNHPTFAPSDVLDFINQQGSAIDAFHASAVGAGLAGVLLQIFFAGGMISVLGKGPFSFGQFLEPARRNLWHNVKCLGFFAVSAGIVLGAWFWGEDEASSKLLESVPPDAVLRSVEHWGSLVVGLLLFGALSLLYDFARAARRFSPTIGAVRGYRFAWLALSGSWTRALVLFLFWSIGGGAVVLAVIAAAWFIPAVSVPAIAVLFLIQFGALWARSAVRVATWGSYLGFLENRSRKAMTRLSRPAYPVPAASRAF